MLVGLKVKSFIGGLPVEEDKKKLKGCHIAIGAPGRIRHLIESGFFKTEYIKLFVLDEADKLVEQNFQTDINQVFHKLPVKKQVIASSATYPNHLDTFLSRYMHSPCYVSADADGSLLLGLKQFVSVVKMNTNIVQQLKVKNEKLDEILSKVSFSQCLVFTNYQTRAESVSNILNQKGWNSSFISAAQDQKKRIEVVNSLKKCNCRILLSTDLTARGIDAANVDLVINYDVPYDAATYLHRMGRAGRYGSKGVCITLCANEKELKDFKHIVAVIAGPEAAVAKLEQIPSDLLNCDYNSFEMIYGEVNDIDSAKQANKTVKSTLMDLKSQNSVKIETNDNEEKSDLKSENEEKQNQDIIEKIPEDDSLNTRQVEVINLIEQNFKEKELLVENTVAYNITKLWANKDKHNDNDLKQQVSNLVKKFPEKLEDSDEKKVAAAKQKISSVDLEEVLKNIEHYCQEQEENTIEEELINDSVSLETLFEFAYSYACGQSDKHWTSFLPHDDKYEFENYCNPSVDLDDEEEDDYEGYYEDDDEINTAGSDASSVEIKQPVTYLKEASSSRAQLEDTIIQGSEPFLKNDFPQQQSSDFTEQFQSYFDECGKTLESMALTFENLESFDQWFYYNWQTQVGHIREFVRQNIYVHEMRQYQDKLLNKDEIQ